MQIRNFIFTKLFILILGFVFAHAAFSASSDPVGLLQGIADTMLSELKNNKVTLKSNPNVVYSLTYKIIVPHADMEEMSKRVLSAQTWNSATPAQRAEFEKAFTRILVRTYASGLANYQDQTVQFFPVRGGYAGKKSIQVNSEIDTPGGSPLQVSYSLVNSGNGWRLYDMSVEGVSMLESFRSQFADILSQGNMSTLLKQLAQHSSAQR